MWTKLESFWAISFVSSWTSSDIRNLQILAKASQAANNLSVEAGYVTEENKEQILQKAESQAQGIANKAKDYTPA